MLGRAAIYWLNKDILIETEKRMFSAVSHDVSLIMDLKSVGNLHFRFKDPWQTLYDATLSVKNSLCFYLDVNLLVRLSGQVPHPVGF